MMETTLVICFLLLVVEGQAQNSGSGCGQTLYCLSRPEGCDSQQSGNCTAFASFGISADGTKVDYRLSSQRSTYIAVGITPTFSMDNTDVYACTQNSEVVRSRNDGYTNQDRSLIGVSDMSVNVTNGVISCQFSRVLSLSNGGNEFFDLTAMDYYVSMVWGGELVGSSLRQHPASNIIGGGPFDLTEQPSSPVTSSVETPGASGCGETMGCFSIPQGCNPDQNCQAFSSWVATEDKTEVSIVIQATTDTYIAMGFSKSGGMDNTEVYACTSNLELLRARNDGRQNIPLPLKGVSGETVTSKNGVIRCNFTRSVTLGDGDNSFFNLSSGNEHTILLAWSGQLLADGNLARHAQREASPEKVDVTAIAAVEGAPSNVGVILRRLHGALMVLAWLCFASIGITTARYFKDLPGTMCGKPKWFFIHRGSMSLVLLFCIAAFVLVIVAVGGIFPIGGSQTNIIRSLHAIFGFIVIGLCIINVIMALFRPHPGTPRRNLYNWAHWGVGTSAHLIAFFTILAGTANFAGQSQAPVFFVVKPYLFWLVVGFVGFHIFLWIIFTGFQVYSNPKDSVGSKDITLQTVNGVHQATPAPAQEKVTLSPTMIGLYWLYVAITLATTVSIVVIIFL